MVFSGSEAYAKLLEGLSGEGLSSAQIGSFSRENELLFVGEGKDGDGMALQAAINVVIEAVCNGNVREQGGIYSLTPRGKRILESLQKEIGGPRRTERI